MGIHSAAHFRQGTDYKNWRDHGTNDYLLILTLGGCGKVISGSAEVMATEGTVTLYHPHVHHHYDTDPQTGHWDFLFSHFLPQPQWRVWMNWPEKTHGFRSLVLKDKTVFKKATAAMNDTIFHHRQHLPGSTELALNALERAILWINSANHDRPLDERIRKAVDILSENLDKPFSLVHLAKDCGLSVSRLSHLFQEQIGEPPRQYLERLRLQLAVQLLQSSNLSIGEIAEETGYENAFYFSLRFKKAFGKSPSLCRKFPTPIP